MQSGLAKTAAVLLKPSYKTYNQSGTKPDLTRSLLHQLGVDFLVLLLQRFDVALLAEEEVGDRCLTHDQHTGQKSQTCHFIGPRGAGTEE